MPRAFFAARCAAYRIFLCKCADGSREIPTPDGVPVAIDGAKPGQVLQVDIQSIEPFYDWGYSGVRPLAGALPHDFGDTRVFHVVLDR